MTQRLRIEPSEKSERRSTRDSKRLRWWIKKEPSRRRNGLRIERLEDRLQLAVDVGDTIFSALPLNTNPAIISENIGDRPFESPNRDLDMYRIEGIVGEFVSIAVTELRRLEANFGSFPTLHSTTSYLRLFDSSGSELALGVHYFRNTGEDVAFARDNPAIVFEPAGGARLLQQLPYSGSYYVGISRERFYNPLTGIAPSVIPREGGTYHLYVERMSSSQALRLDQTPQVPPTDVPGRMLNARPIEVPLNRRVNVDSFIGDPNSLYAHEFGVGIDDVDFYSVDLDAGDFLDVYASIRARGLPDFANNDFDTVTGNDNTWIRLFDSNGVQLAPTASGLRYFTVPATGRYYIGASSVTDYNPYSANDGSLYGTIGQYRLTIERTSEWSPNTYTVTSSSDSGSGSLRQAIEYANAWPGNNRIVFDIGNGGSASIHLQSPLPAISDYATSIDGTTQSGYTGTPLIEIDGSDLPVGQAALWTTAIATGIRGLAVNQANGVGIFLSPGADSAVIRDNYIGTDLSGKLDRGNLYQGIYVASSTNRIFGNVVSGNDANGIWIAGDTAQWNRVEDNLIGLDATGSMVLGNGINGIYMSAGASNNRLFNNVISGNRNTGIWLQDASQNWMQGNYIGTDRSGHVDIGNISTGIRFSDGSSQNFFGVTPSSDEFGNLVSGNGGRGIEIYSDNTTGNWVRGNIVGMDINGVNALGNDLDGIYFSGTANTLGGYVPAERNLISGNAGAGVELVGLQNNVLGNLIGTDSTGTLDRGNVGSGLNVRSDNHLIAYNTISGNDGNGVEFAPDADNNRLVGNHIGTNLMGTAAIGNRLWGVWHGGGTSNQIGIPSSDTVDRNLVSGNLQGGIAVWGSTTAGNRVQNNYIGTDVTGMVDLGNASSGMIVGYMFNPSDASTGTVVGGSGPNEGNLISGNGGSGIWIRGEADATIEGNLVGLASDRTTALGNTQTGVQISGSGNRVGGFQSGAGNVISGNLDYGVGFAPFASNNLVQNNRIGMTASGLVAVGNRQHGVYVTGDSNEISGNTIAGNGGSGIAVSNGAVRNQINENRIGTNVSGNSPLGNAVHGIELAGDANTIDSNVIAGNRGSGIAFNDAHDNTLTGNLIGLGADGLTAMGHPAVGIYLIGTGNHIGGPAPDDRNVISSSGFSGIELFGEGTVENVIQGNRIGTDRTGSIARGNGTADIFDSTGGVYLGVGTSRNLIGTDGDGVNDDYEGNLISGNLRDGIRLVGSTDNQIAGNTIGLDSAGNPLSNNDGIRLDSGADRNQIGGTVDSGNVISGNRRAGIQISGSHRNWVSGNNIGVDAEGNSAIGNTAAGVWIRGGATENLVGTNGDGLADELERNVIAGNAQGVRISNGTSIQNVIAGNLIGTDASGTKALGNLWGVWIHNGANHNRIGVSGSVSESNLISGNIGFGVRVEGAGTDHNRIAGNAIGTDLSYSVALGNGNHGISVVDGASQTLIGTDGDGESDEIEGNLISGNSNGIRLSDVLFTVIAGNRIGTDPSGQHPISNRSAGIFVSGESFDTRIGSNLDGFHDDEEANRIAYNSSTGINVGRDSFNVTTGDPIRTTIRGNSISSNAYLGIDLLNSQGGIYGVTVNDPGDVDSGPNNLMNFPVLDAAWSGSETLIQGEFWGAPDAAIAIDLYVNRQASPSGYGEGELYLGAIEVETDAFGYSAFSFVTSSVPGYSFVTATATDALGNSSEFSVALPIEVITMSGNAIVPEGSPYILELSDGGGNQSSQAWTVDWGDGTTSSVSGNLSEITHVYADGPADFIVTASANINGNVISALDTILVYVVNVSPSLATLVPVVAKEGETIRLSSDDLILPDGTVVPSVVDGVQFYDPGFTRQLSGATAESFTATMDWGDGTVDSTNDGSLALNLIEGQVEIPTLGTIFTEHVYSDDGSFTAILTVIDDDGGVASKQFVIVVQNIEPVIRDLFLTPSSRGLRAEVFFAATDASPADEMRGFDFTIDWGDGTVETIAASPLNGNGLVMDHLYASTGTFNVSVAARDKDSSIGQASVALTVQVDSQSIGDDLQSAVDWVSGTADPTVNLDITSNRDFAATVAAIRNLQTSTGPVTIKLDLNGGTFSEKKIKVPAGILLVISNGTLRGASPVLSIEGGSVRVESTTLLNDTDAPTLEVSGGSVVLRGSRVVESTTGAQFAILVAGGTLDLGTAGSPGHNMLEVIGPGALIRNLGEESIDAIGNDFLVDHQPLTSGFRIEDLVDHRLDGLGGLVMFRTQQLFVTRQVGDIQTGVDEAGDGDTIRVEGISYPSFSVDERLISVAFETGAMLRQFVDDELSGRRSVEVVGTPADDRIRLHGTRNQTEVLVDFAGLPWMHVTPLGRVIVRAGAGDDKVWVSGNGTISVWIYGEAGNDDLDGGHGDDVLVGGEGNDKLHGKQGKNVLIGGGGKDQLKVNASEDLILDETPGDDETVLRGDPALIDAALLLLFSGN